MDINQFPTLAMDLESRDDIVPTHTATVDGWVWAICTQTDEISTAWIAYPHESNERLADTHAVYAATMEELGYGMKGEALDSQAVSIRKS